MSGRMRIKTGSIEIEYETDKAVSISDLKDILEFLGKHQGQGSQFGTSPFIGPSDGTSIAKLDFEGVLVRTKAKAVPEYIVSAAGYLHFMEGTQQFTQADLLKLINTSQGAAGLNVGNDISKEIAEVPGLLEETATGSGVYQLTGGAQSLLGSIFKA